MTARNPYELAHLVGVSDPDLIAENYRSKSLTTLVTFLAKVSLEAPMTVSRNDLANVLEIAAGRDLDEAFFQGA